MNYNLMMAAIVFVLMFNLSALIFTEKLLGNTPVISFKGMSKKKKRKKAKKYIDINNILLLYAVSIIFIIVCIIQGDNMY